MGACVGKQRRSTKRDEALARQMQMAELNPPQFGSAQNVSGYGTTANPAGFGPTAGQYSGTGQKLGGGAMTATNGYSQNNNPGQNNGGYNPPSTNQSTNQSTKSKTSSNNRGGAQSFGSGQLGGGGGGRVITPPDERRKRQLEAAEQRQTQGFQRGGVSEVKAKALQEGQVKEDLIGRIQMQCRMKSIDEPMGLRLATVAQLQDTLTRLQSQ